MRTGRVIKCTLSVSILTMLVALVIVSYKAFSHQFSPIQGSIAVLVMLGIEVWLIALSNGRRYRRVKPGFLTVTLIALVAFIITAFAGVSPMSTYKDTALRWVSSVVGKHIVEPITAKFFPYGSYVCAQGIFTETLTLTSHGTYQRVWYAGAAERGTYTVDSRQIAFTDGATRKIEAFAYRYSEELDALYIYDQYGGSVARGFFREH